MEGFLHYDFGGLIHGGAYFWEFYGIKLKILQTLHPITTNHNLSGIHLLVNNLLMQVKLTLKSSLDRNTFVGTTTLSPDLKAKFSFKENSFQN